jgi:predicted nucleic acid-binding protein
VRVYVETNFILEMAFEQEQSAACDEILQLAEANAIRLAIPAFCFTEPHGRLRRQSHERGELQKKLAREQREFGRSSRATDEQKKAWSTVTGMLVSSTQEAEQRLDALRVRLLRAARILPLTATVIEAAATGVTQYGLQFPDALVLATVLLDLESNQDPSCFLNTNSNDFNEPAVVEELKKRVCKPIWRFADGLAHVRALVQKATE